MTHVSPFLRYLAIPPDYRPTKELRWSKQGDAIETESGRTFFVRAGLPALLEGFAAKRPLMHFVYFLELLHLLGHRDQPPAGLPAALCRQVCDAFRGEGMPLRNAGAFFAEILKEVPPAHLPGHNDLELTKWLARTPSLQMDGWLNSEAPPLSADEFHQLLTTKLGDYSEEALRSWFRFGRGAIKEAAPLAEALDNKTPNPAPSLDDLLNQSPRLAGALPLVGRLVSALSLPPRRRTPPQLPLGGYADVTTRGDPERLLPSQFALDQDEFVRRFAERELMYFQREEPPQRSRETLVLLVDQGARTWGSVRLVLAAAVLAFRKLAERRKQDWQVRFTAAPDRLIDPNTCEPKEFVNLLEASDLTLEPSKVIETERDRADATDAILLTHPFALHDASVRDACRGWPDAKRLFALTVDEDGNATFSRMIGFEPKAICKFKVPAVPEVAPVDEERVDELLWTGDVEPVPHPFQVCPVRDTVDLDFDPDAHYLLRATAKGYLFLWRLSDRSMEMLPRGWTKEGLLDEPARVFGVRGGFVVCHHFEDEVAVAHYDLRRRKVNVHRPEAWCLNLQWHVDPCRPSVILEGEHELTILDLPKGAMQQVGKFDDQDSIRTGYRQECERFERHEHWLPVFEVSCPSADAPPTRVEYGRGTIYVHEGGKAKMFRIEEDGEPVSFAGKNCRAQLRGDVLAWSEGVQLSQEVSWRILDRRTAEQVVAFKTQRNGWAHCRLSPDGRLFASPVGSNRPPYSGSNPVNPADLGIRDVENGQRSLLGSNIRGHSNLQIELKQNCLVIRVGAAGYVLDWAEGPLTVKFGPDFWVEVRHPTVAASSRTDHPLKHRLHGRFIAVARNGLDALVDDMGQITIYDPKRERVVCMFFPWRGKLAAWMPDGTRYGPPELIAGPCRPDALERIGHALRQAGGDA